MIQKYVNKCSIKMLDNELTQHIIIPTVLLCVIILTPLYDNIITLLLYNQFCDSLTQSMGGNVKMVLCSVRSLVLITVIFVPLSLFPVVY